MKLDGKMKELLQINALDNKQLPKSSKVTLVRVPVQMLRNLTVEEQTEVVIFAPSLTAGRITSYTVGLLGSIDTLRDINNFKGDTFLSSKLLEINPGFLRPQQLHYFRPHSFSRSMERAK